MTRYIDADALLPMMKYATTDSEIGVFPIKIGFNAIAKVIEDAPTVDTVPVIRCKDCKYRDPEDHKCDCGHDIRWQLPREDNWFCADAERKEE